MLPNVVCIIGLLIITKMHISCEEVVRNLIVTVIQPRKLQTSVCRWSGSPEGSSRFRLVAQRSPQLLLGECHSPRSPG